MGRFGWRVVAIGASYIGSLAVLLLVPRYLQAGFVHVRHSFPDGWMTGSLLMLLASCSTLVVRSHFYATWVVNLTERMCQSIHQTGFREDIYQPRRLLLPSGCSFFGSLMCSLGSYYCLMPDAMMLHGPAFVASRPSAWSDVKVVTAWCHMGRYGSGGGVNLLLEGGDDISVGLNYGREFLRSDF